MAAALRAIVTEDATAAAEENVLVALDEAGDLDPWLFEVQRRMREEGRPGMRIRVDELVERAMADALAVWEQVNPAKWSLDHRWLALDEIAAIRRIDRDLADLTSRAAERARDERAAAEAPVTIRSFFDDHDFGSGHRDSLPGGRRVDARVGQAERDSVPEAALRVFDAFFRIEAAGAGSVTLHQGPVGERTVWVVYATAGGDEAYLEVMDENGATLDGARLLSNRIIGWDEFPGRVRLSSLLTTIDGVTFEEGLSEADERAVAGQPPHRWEGEAVLDGTLLYPALDRLGRIDFGDIELSDELRELAVAAIDHLWDMPLRYSSHAGQPVELGPNRAGVLSVGSFTRPTDGQTYQVANWRDIDDASFVLYYQRGEHGLRLAISQFDN